MTPVLWLFVPGDGAAIETVYPDLRRLHDLCTSKHLDTVTLKQKIND